MIKDSGERTEFGTGAVRDMHSGKGRAVVTYKGDDVTIEEVMELLKNPEVITLTVTKETPAQYLKRVGPVNNP